MVNELAQPPPTNERLISTRILLHTPDITLKGKNQKDFRHALVANIKRRLKHFNLDWQVISAKGRISIRPQVSNKKQLDKVVLAMQQTAGISSLSVCDFIPGKTIVSKENEFNWPVLEEAVLSMAKSVYQEESSFAINVNRTFKEIPVRSIDIAVRLGDLIRNKTRWDKVKLKDPGQTFHIDIYPDGFYLYAHKYKGIGGLPTGTAGRVLALLSGGIDSPVAIYQLAKRGCHIDFLHLSASHVDKASVDSSVIGQLARQLSRYTQRSRLHVLPYTYFDLNLTGKKTGYELVMFRRFMMRIAERLAERIHCLALINGDSLGQVASQTLENIATSNSAISIPVFRPLIGTNKEEIIAIARSIGTYELSIQPYKDCCALIAQHPKTRSSHEKISSQEVNLFTDYEEVINKTLDDAVVLEYQFGELLESN